MSPLLALLFIEKAGAWLASTGLSPSGSRLSSGFTATASSELKKLSLKLRLSVSDVELKREANLDLSELKLESTLKFIDWSEIGCLTA